MTWVTPPSFNTGTVITQTKLDQVTGNLNALWHPVQRDTTDKTVSSTNIETSLFNSVPTIPANSMGANGAVRCEIIGYITGNGAITATLRFKFGSSSTQFMAGVTSTNSTVYYRIIYDVFNRGSTNAQYQHFTWLPIGGSWGSASNPSATSAIDTTADQTLDVTMQWGTSSGAVAMNAAVRLLTVGQLI